MLKSKLIHPEILQALGGSGHFSQVLIADGNYPILSGTNPATKRVFLNLAPGTVGALEVLEVILTAIPVQEATTMISPDDFHPDIHDEYRAMLGDQVKCERWSAGRTMIKLSRQTQRWLLQPESSVASQTCC